MEKALCYVLEHNTSPIKKERENKKTPKLIIEQGSFLFYYLIFNFITDKDLKACFPNLYISYFIIDNW